MPGEAAGATLDPTPFFVAAAAAIVAFFGWRASFNNSLEIEKHKAELARVNDQIQHLYGPLRALIETRRVAMDVLVDLHAPGRREFFDGSKQTPEALRQWRLWRVEVLMPLVVKMQEAILENSHLVEGGALPESFELLMQHVSVYKAVIANWTYFTELDELDATGAPQIDAQEMKDGEWDPVVAHVATINFPKSALLKDIEPTLQRLQARQRELFARTQGKS